MSASESNNVYNLHLLNLKSLVELGNCDSSKVSKNFACMVNRQLDRSGFGATAEEQARRSLEAVRCVVQESVNNDVTAVLNGCMEKYFEPAFNTVEKNCSRSLDKSAMKTIMCR